MSESILYTNRYYESNERELMRVPCIGGPADGKHVFISSFDWYEGYSTNLYIESDGRVREAERVRWGAQRNTHKYILRNIDNILCAVFKESNDGSV
jgi:hypothetical protein